jgi:hypothetical protein
MTASTGTAQKIAAEYARAWLGRDAATALGFVADDVVCQAPTGLIEGRDGYRQFLEPFAANLAAGQLIDVLGDDEHAVTVYTVDTPLVKDFRGVEYLTVEDGRITRVISVFDRLPMVQAQGGLKD